MPHSRIMIHQPLGGAEGRATDVEIAVRELIKTKKLLTSQLAEFTGKDEKELHEAMELDNYMTTEEAKDFGLIDEVLTKKI